MVKAVHYFIPHKSNNHKPFFTRHPGLTTILIFTLFIQSSINIFFSSNPRILGFATNIYKDEIINLTNNERTKNGLRTLYHNPTLDKAAQLKAQDMFAKDYWAHVSPDGVEPWHWFEVVGYNYSAAGENLARDFDTSSGVVSAWMASPSHRDNILYANFTEIGVAVVDGNLDGEDTTLVVQLFGTPPPQSEVVVEPIANPTATPTPTLKPTSIPPTATPTVIRPTTIQSSPTVAPTNTPTPTTTPSPTPSPTPVYAMNQPTNNPTKISTLGSTDQNPPKSQFFTNLAVIENIASFSANRIFTIVLILALMLLLGSESAVLWYKGIEHPHAQRIIHVGILFLTLLATLYGAGGSIL